MDLGVLVASSPRLLHPTALDSHEDNDDGGEDADDHCSHSDGDQVLLLESLLDHILGPGVNILQAKIDLSFIIMCIALKTHYIL